MTCWGPPGWSSRRPWALWWVHLSRTERFSRPAVRLRCARTHGSSRGSSGPGRPGARPARSWRPRETRSNRRQRPRSPSQVGRAKADRLLGRTVRSAVGPAGGHHGHAVGVGADDQLRAASCEMPDPGGRGHGLDACARLQHHRRTPSTSDLRGDDGPRGLDPLVAADLRLEGHGRDRRTTGLDREHTHVIPQAGPTIVGPDLARSLLTAS